MATRTPVDHKTPMEVMTINEWVKQLCAIRKFGEHGGWVMPAHC